MESAPVFLAGAIVVAMLLQNHFFAIMKRDLDLRGIYTRSKVLRKFLNSLNAFSTTNEFILPWDISRRRMSLKYSIDFFLINKWTFVNHAKLCCSNLVCFDK